jgi:hypothetical protein
MAEVTHDALAPLHIDIDKLQPHPDNANRGNVDVIVESIEINGLYRPVVYQTSTGYILAGNHTWQAAKAHGMDTIPAIGLDVDEERAKRILLVDNRARDKAEWDHDALAALLEGLDDLTGTGYTDEEAADLLRLCEPPDLDDLVKDVGEWKPSDSWPTLKITCPPEVASAWEEHVADAGGDGAQALAQLLDVPL